MSIQLQHSFGLNAKVIVFKEKIGYFSLNRHYISTTVQLSEQYAGHLKDYSSWHYRMHEEIWMDIGKIYQFQAEKYTSFLLLRETMTSFCLEMRRAGQREKVLQNISLVRYFPCEQDDLQLNN